MRSNQDWLDGLRGDCGEAEQALAHEGLALYLYDEVYEYLQQRQAKANPWRLSRLSGEALGALAQDFVQQTLTRLAEDDFALLLRFRGVGKFTSWMKVIVINEARQELRSPYWNRGVWWSLSEGDDEVAHRLERWGTEDVSLGDPQKRVMQEEVISALENCLDKLDSELRKVLLGLVVERERAAALAVSLGRFSARQVYSEVKRAKRHLRRCLGKAGWDRELFDLF